MRREDVGDRGAERLRPPVDRLDLLRADARVDRDRLAVRDEEQRGGLPERALETLDVHRRGAYARDVIGSPRFGPFPGSPLQAGAIVGDDHIDFPAMFTRVSQVCWALARRLVIGGG